MLNDVSKSQTLTFPKEFTHDFGNQKNFSLLIFLENKARNNIEYCCRSKISLFRLQKCPFSKSKKSDFSKGANPLFWSVPFRKYGDVICPLQKRSFTVLFTRKTVFTMPVVMM